MNKTIINNAIGHVIKMMRVEKNLSQIDLAKKMGSTQNQIHKWEKKCGIKISMPSILRICSALETEPKIFFDKIKNEIIRAEATNGHTK